MMLKRFIYFGYYVKKLDRKKFLLFLDHTAKLTKRSKAHIVADVISSVFKYNISILEYFQFRFFEKNAEERGQWAGTGHMYEYQLKMNPLESRDILDDKRKFYQSYRKYFVHNLTELSDLKSKPELLNKMFDNPSGKIVFKAADGNCGAQVGIVKTADMKQKDMISYMEKNHFDLAEDFIIQHPAVNALSPSGVNTVRIFTQLNVKDEVGILGCRLRISVNSPVDNMAAGNLAAPIDEKTGIVSGPAVYSDITKPEEPVHPITGVPIVGFQVPFWQEALAMAKEAALTHPQNRSIGWDIVITENGPGFIEGNHDWCKLLWQLPAKKGLKYLLEMNV